MPQQVPYKPQGFQALVPYFMVNDAPKLVAFLKSAFAAEELDVSKNEDGSIANARLRIDDCMVEISEARAEWPAVPMVMHLFVKDTDAVFKRAVESDGKPIHEPMDHPYGERSCGVTDPCGNQWFIATQIPIKK
ncbi:MAG: VOC family protein [Gammaproteobacteria bacterium]|nr:VOC family protein [Gammaproteobacteria bacterium]